jgi:hypothetical protein
MTEPIRSSEMLFLKRRTSVTSQKTAFFTLHLLCLLEWKRESCATVELIIVHRYSNYGSNLTIEYSIKPFKCRSILDIKLVPHSLTKFILQIMTCKLGTRIWL